MFTLKHGNDQQTIYNSNVQSSLLLQHIAHTLHYKGLEIDLAEESSGLLQFLRDSPTEYASSILKPRSCYILIEVKRSEDGNVSYVPLWENSNAKQTFIVKAQKQMLTRGRPKSGANKKEIEKEKSLKTMQQSIPKKKMEPSTPSTAPHH